MNGIVINTIISLNSHFVTPTGIEKEINDTKYSIKKAVNSGHMKAARDLNKHLDRLYKKKMELKKCKSK